MASSHSSKSSKSKSDTVVEDSQINEPLENGPKATDKEIMLRRGFYLGKTLGSGSYSKVKFAVTKDNFNKVAIKIIDRREAPTDYQYAFLPRELNYITFFKNPNVIRTYDWFEEKNHKIYQILEFAESGDVLEYVRTKSEGAVGMTLTQKWVLQAARAVAYLHIQRLAHRDIKCENLLLDADMDIKLSDFGFIRPVLWMQLSDTFCGSAAYAAPEIIRSQPFDPLAADVWALGVVAFILATGYMPFGDDVRNVSKILAAQQQELKFPESEPPVCEKCKTLIRSMLTVDVSKRIDIHMVLADPWFECLDLCTSWPRMEQLEW